jgi:ribosomal-protein-alanine N-acetyltransferase
MKTRPVSPVPRRKFGPLHQRWMNRHDVPEVLAIEAASHLHPRDEDGLLQLLRQKQIVGMVAEHGLLVVGFMIYELGKGKINLIDFAVAAECRRMGVGQQMISRLWQKLSLEPGRRNRLVVRVRETNLDGQFFFQSQGFLAHRVEREYFEDSGEDAYVMAYRLQSLEAQ